MDILYQRTVPYPLARAVSQYFDLEHLEHVHPRSFGRARLVSQAHDAVIWDLEWPRLFGAIRPRNRIRQQFLPPDRIQAVLGSGPLRGMRVDIRFNQADDGTLVAERYNLPFPDWPWLRPVVQGLLVGWLDRIWEEDLKTGYCHGGWPGVPGVPPGQ